MIFLAAILYTIGFVLQGISCSFYDMSWAPFTFWFGLIVSFWGFYCMLSELLDMKKEIAKLNRNRKD